MLTKYDLETIFKEIAKISQLTLEYPKREVYLNRLQSKHHNWFKEQLILNGYDPENILVMINSQDIESNRFALSICDTIK